MRLRTTALAATALGIALLTGCGTSPTADTSTNGQRNADTSTDTGAVDCEDSDNLSQADWAKHCADDAGNEKQPPADLNLKVGQTVEYDDGVTVTVDKVSTITAFGEYDTRPEPGQNAFRVHLTLSNTGKQSASLDEFYVTVEGATNGGQAMDLYVEEGAQDLMGRLAPGVKDVKKNAAFALDKAYGEQVIVTLDRFNEDGSFFDEAPTFAGAIR